MKLDTIKSVVRTVASQVAVSAAMVAVDQTVRTFVDAHIKRRIRVRDEHNTSK